MPLSYFDGTADTGAVVEALRRDGAVVVTDLAEPRLVDTIRAELRPRLDASGLKSRSDFNGSRTLRSNSVLSTAPSAAGLVDHDAGKRSVAGDQRRRARECRPKRSCAPTKKRRIASA